MTENQWYAFYPGDYLRKTAHLSLLEHGAYRLLIDHYYATGGPIPSDPEKLYRICRARNRHERAAVIFVSTNFFSISDSLLHNEKCDCEIAKRLKFKEAQSARARLRHQSGTSKSPAIPQPQPQKKGGGKPPPPPTPELPEWIPPQAWEAFRDMRLQIKSAMTANAERLVIGELAKLRQAGHDPKAVLEQSIRNNWKDVYKLKEEHHANARFGHQGPSPKPTKDDRARAAVLRAVAAFDNPPEPGGEEAARGPLVP